MTTENLRNTTRPENPQTSTLYPKDILRDAATQPRPIERCWWFHPVRIDFDISDDQLDQSPIFQELSGSIQKQGHKQPRTPSNTSDMIITAYTIPSGTEPLEQRVLEIDPLALKIGEEYCITDVLQRNVTAIVTMTDDLVHMNKREAENYVRMLMIRLGALKIIINHPEYYALATMEGGLGVEYKTNPQAIDCLRDRLVTHACAKESGQYIAEPNVIDEKEWQQSSVPDYLVAAFTTLGQDGFIAPPFEIASVATPARTRLTQILMGYGRQSESAGLAFDPSLSLPERFRMGLTTGAIVTTGTGKFNVNKRNMNRDADLPCVGIVPLADLSKNRTGQLQLNAFGRYVFGRVGVSRTPPPSIEFDEMAATLHEAPLMHVSLHSNGQGYILDPKGEIVIPRVRAFLHMHVGVDAMQNDLIGGGVSIFKYAEYVPPNLKDFPYSVGCGKDIMFACSTDAAQRSVGVQDTKSGIGIVFFDATNHGTNFLLLTEPFPGTDCIPYNPFQLFLNLVHPQSGPIRLTQEILQI